MTSKQRIYDELMVNGKIDNFYCIDNRISLRLGAVIFSLVKEKKIEIDEDKSGYLGETKNWCYYLKNKETLF